MTQVSRIAVLIADDHELVRKCLRGGLQQYPNIEVIGEVADGEEAVAATFKLKPTVVVMDINMDKMDGITATRLIKTLHPEVVVIGLTADPKDYQVYAMTRAGASEVLNKDKAVYELYPAIQRSVASIQPIVILNDNTASAESSRMDCFAVSEQESPAEQVQTDRARRSKATEN